MSSEHVTVNPRTDRMHSRHHRNARGVAGGRCAMGVGEGNRTTSQALEVRSLDSRMIIQRRDVVVQVINADEQDVRLGFRKGPNPRQGKQAHEQLFHSELFGSDLVRKSCSSQASE